MTVKEISLQRVPGLAVIQQVLSTLDREAILVAAGHDFDSDTYYIYFSINGNKGKAVFGQALLDDLQANKKPIASDYSRSLQEKVSGILQEAILKMSSS